MLSEIEAALSDARRGERLREGFAVAIAGAPNAGKSTLLNVLAQRDVAIVSDIPGTTRDAIEVPFAQGTRRYVLVDTAGVRRKGRVTEVVEKFSVIKTMQAVERANVAVLVLDATQEIADQDAHLGGFILEAGRALVVAVNKWDAVDDYRRSLVKTQLGSKLGFLSFARTVFLSAAKGQGLAPLLKAVDEAYAAAFAKLPTPQLTRVLQELVKRQAPPRHGLFRPKPRYAHQGGSNPPVIVIHGNALEHLSKSYRRYLEHGFLEAFRLRGTPLKFEWRTSENPYVKRSD